MKKMKAVLAVILATIIFVSNLNMQKVIANELLIENGMGKNEDDDELNNKLKTESEKESYNEDNDYSEKVESDYIEKNSEIELYEESNSISVDSLDIVSDNSLSDDAVVRKGSSFRANELGKHVIYSFETLYEDKRKLKFDTYSRPLLDDLIKMMPQKLEVTLDGQEENDFIEVEWNCDGDYEDGYYFEFNPSWDNAKYRLSEDVNYVPQIIVEITPESTNNIDEEKLCGRDNNLEIESFDDSGELVIQSENPQWRSPKQPLPRLTGNKRRDAIEIAKSQIGYREQSYNNNAYAYELKTVYGEGAGWGTDDWAWCAYFVRWIQRRVNNSDNYISVGQGAGSTRSTCSWFYNRQKYHSKTTWNNIQSTDASYIGKPGDFIAIDNQGDLKPDHTSFLVDRDDTYYYTVEGNLSDQVKTLTYRISDGVCITSGYNRFKISGFGEIEYGDNYEPQNKLPIGHLDSCKGGIKTITIGGWAFDPDDVNAKLDIHVYVGGPAGSGTLYASNRTGNAMRNDVVAQYPEAREDCGFQCTINVSQVGNQPIYVYVIDSQDSSKHAELLYRGERLSAYIYSFDADTVRFDRTIYYVNEEESCDVYYTLNGDVSHVAHTMVELTPNTTEVATITSFDYADKDNNKFKATIHGVKKGGTILKVLLYDFDGNEIFYDICAVNVLEKNEVVIDDKTLTTFPKYSDSSKLSFKGSYSRIGVNIGDSTIASYALIEDKNNKSAVLKITGKKVGQTTATIKTLSASGAVLAQSQIKIVVKEPFEISFDEADPYVWVGEQIKIYYTAIENFDGIYGVESSVENDGEYIEKVSHGMEYKKRYIEVKGLKPGKSNVIVRFYGLLNNQEIVLNEKKIEVTIVDISIPEKKYDTSQWEYINISASIVPSSFSGARLKYSVEDNNILTITSNGLARATGVGSTKVIITSTDGRLEKQVIVNVTEEESRFYVIPDVNEASVWVGKKKRVGYIYEAYKTGGGYYSTPSVSIYNPTGIAQGLYPDYVDSEKKEGWSEFEGLKAGKTNMYFKFFLANGKKIYESSIPITVMDIDISRDKEEIRKGDTFKVIANIVPEKSSELGLIYESKNPSIISIDADGNANAVGIGDAVITVKTSDGEYEKDYSVRVLKEQVSVSDISVTPSSNEIYIGEEFNMYTTINPLNATDKSVSYNSSDSNVAIVNDAGKIKGLKEGSAIISAVAKNGIKGTCKVKVMVPTSLDIVGGLSRSVNLGEPIDIDFNFAGSDIIVDISDAEEEKVSTTFGKLDYKSGTGTIKVYGKKIGKADIEVVLIKRELIVERKKISISICDDNNVGENNLKNASISLANNSFKYTGEDIKLSSKDIVVTAKNGYLLNDSNDYDISYPSADYQNTGIKEIIITGKGEYYGSISAYYKIFEDEYEHDEKDNYEKYDISGETVTITIPQEKYEYTGEEIKPVVSVKSLTEGTLTEGKDYSVKYSNNKNIGMASIEVIGQGEYYGIVKIDFEIIKVEDGNTEKYDISGETVIITIPQEKYEYTGEEIKPVVSVKSLTEGTLTEGKDYSVKYSNNKNVGTASIEVFGQGEYYGIVKIDFEIIKVEDGNTEKYDIAGETVTITIPQEKYEYTGEEIKPVVSVKSLTEGILAEGKDYSVKYSNNRNVGTASIEVFGQGEYYGIVKIDFEIIKAEDGNTDKVKFDYTKYHHVKVEDAITAYGCIIAAKGEFDVKPYIQGATRFKSSDKKIASVSGKKGLVKGKKSGKVTITGQVKSGKNWVDVGTYTVHIVMPKINKSDIKNMDVSASISGNEIIENETLIPSSWKSSKPEVASVDETTGEIRIGSKRGTTKITAYYGSGKNAAKYKFKMRVKTSKSPSNNSSSQEGNSSVANVEAVAIF